MVRLAASPTDLINNLVQGRWVSAIANATEIVESVPPAECHLGGRAFLEIRSARERSGAGNHIDGDGRRRRRGIVAVVVGHYRKGVASDGSVGPVESIRKRGSRAE